MARLVLVTPRTVDPTTFPATLDAVLAAGDVASLIVDVVATPAVRQTIAAALTPVAQARGVAVVVRNDSRTAGRAKADGVHIDGSAADLEDALATFHPNGIVGVGGLSNRHEAMEAGETAVDYVFFGDLDRAEAAEADRRALDLAAWWVPLFEPPVVVMGGGSLDTLDAAIDSGAEFVALRDAVWSHAGGAAAAVAVAAERLAAAEAEAGSESDA